MSVISLCNEVAPETIKSRCINQRKMSCFSLFKLMALMWRHLQSHEMRRVVSVHLNPRVLYFPFFLKDVSQNWPQSCFYLNFSPQSKIHDHKLTYLQFMDMDFLWWLDYGVHRYDVYQKRTKWKCLQTKRGSGKVSSWSCVLLSDCILTVCVDMLLLRHRN